MSAGGLLLNPSAHSNIRAPSFPRVTSADRNNPPHPKGNTHQMALLLPSTRPLATPPAPAAATAASARTRSLLHQQHATPLLVSRAHAARTARSSARPLQQQQQPLPAAAVAQQHQPQTPAQRRRVIARADMGGGRDEVKVGTCPCACAPSLVTCHTTAATSSSRALASLATCVPSLLAAKTRARALAVANTQYPPPPRNQLQNRRG